MENDENIALAENVNVNVTDQLEYQLAATTLNSTEDLNRDENIALAEYVNMIRSNEPDQILLGTSKIRNLLSVPIPAPVQSTIDTGIIPTIIGFLTKFDQPELQHEACWVLTNVACGNTEQTAFIVNLGVIPLMLDLLDTDNLDLIEQAVWGLANIAGEGKENTNLILEQQGMIKFVNVFQAHKADICLVRKVIWGIFNFVRFEGNFELTKICLPVLSEVMRTMNDKEVLSDTCWALSYISDDNTPHNSQIQAVIDSGVIPFLIVKLSNATRLLLPSLRTVGNISSGSDCQTETIITAIPIIVNLGKHADAKVRKECMWTLSNIASGSKQQSQLLLDQGNLMDILSQIVLHDEPAVRCEALWVISNFLSEGHCNQVKFLVNSGVIPLLIKSINLSKSDVRYNNDTRVLIVQMEGLKNLFKVGGRENNDINGDGKGDEKNEYVELFKQHDGLLAINQFRDSQDPRLSELVATLLNYIN